MGMPEHKYLEDKISVLENQMGIVNEKITNIEEDIRSSAQALLIMNQTLNDIKLEIKSWRYAFLGIFGTISIIWTLGGKGVFHYLF